MLVPLAFRQGGRRLLSVIARSGTASDPALLSLPAFRHQARSSLVALQSSSSSSPLSTCPRRLLTTTSPSPPAAGSGAIEPAVFKALVQDLQSAATESDPGKAVATIHKFPRMPIEATQICYNVAIGTCLRAEKMEEATELLNTMIGQLGVRPCLLTYNLLIFAAARKGDWQQAMAYRDELLQGKLRPDESTYHGMIMACGKGKEMKMVPELLSQMDVCLPATYTTAIAALARGREWKKALEMVKRMKEDGLDLETSAYHAAMFACTKESPARWTECLDLLREMKSKGLPVGLTAYNTAILCAGMAHETEAAERLLEELKTAPDPAGGTLKPNNGSYRGLIKSLAKTGNYQKCLDILEEIKSQGLEPDLLLFTDAMDVFAKSQNPGATLRVLDEMKKAKQPDLRLYLAPLIDADEEAERRVFEEFVREVEKLSTLTILE